MAPTPDLFIGIDVGMTCTGRHNRFPEELSVSIESYGMELIVGGDEAVAFAKADMPDPHVIQEWPGNPSANKVPTAVCYNGRTLASWGFLALAEEEGDRKRIKEWFKIYLDPAEYKKAKESGTQADLPLSHERIRDYYRDFLRKLYSYIVKFGELQDMVGRSSWENARIDISFTVPTTWEAVGVIKDFEKLIREAGFGKGGPNHTVAVGLTEAEAAAVHTFKRLSSSYNNGDILLIVDAGGGTTDLALLKVDNAGNARPTLKQLDSVRGDEIGSSMIDTDFHELAMKKLRRIPPGHLSEDVDDLAWEMTRTTFQTHKSELGREDSDLQDLKTIEIPRMPRVTLDAAGIKRGRMTYTKNELEGLFDVQLAKMYKLIDFQIKRMAQVAPSEQITHLVLSGGLGNSPYVKARLKQRYCSPIVRNPHVKDLHIMTAPKPQLAPVKGLLLDRMQDKPIITSRVSRLSLGIICNTLYNPSLHLGQPIYVDQIDGKVYVSNQVVWLLKKGEPLINDYVDHQFFRTMLPNAPRYPWISEIAISHLSGLHLPKNLNQDGANRLANLKSNLTKVPLQRFAEKKKHFWRFWKSRKHHFRATYTIKFLIRPAGVDFELWFEGQRYNEPYSFETEWDEGAHISPPREHRDGDRDWGIRRS